MIAEIITPVMLATVLAVLGMVITLGWDTGAKLAELAELTVRKGGLPGSISSVWIVVWGLLPAVISVSALSVAVQNLAVLILPGWIPLGKLKDTGGSIMTGQHLLLMGAHSLVMVLGLILPIGFIHIVVWLQKLFEISYTVWEVPVLALLASLLILLETVGIVWIAARRWKILDPSFDFSGS